MIEDSRLQTLNDAEPDADGRFVLYWMQASQRAEHNHALEYAIEVANDRGEPVVVLFVLIDDFPEGNARSYAFMLEGLAETAKALRDRGIPFVFKLNEIVGTVLDVAKDASIVITDRGYLAFQRDWRRRVADDVGKRFVQVEANAVVPLEVASTKLESAARTIRPKIQLHVQDYLHALEPRTVETSGANVDLASDLDPTNVDVCLEAIQTDESVPRVSRFIGGTSEGYRHLAHFLRTHLDGYDEHRNEPSKPATSMLSPYLHYGMISPVEAVRRVKASAHGNSADASKFIEELVVRRELANNFVSYEPDYGTWASIPDWAKTTLAEHAGDKRDATYTVQQLEAAETDDPYWNAAMREMLKSGYMHNHMRMYWGKQIVYWIPGGKEAFEIALYLNNKYFLDGRDANSYSNVSWLFGVHDRPWPVQPGFGKVRSMKPSGLKRKFDPDAYVRWVDALDG